MSGMKMRCSSANSRKPACRTPVAGACWTGCRSNSRSTNCAACSWKCADGPNVVYACGALLHGRELVIPYAMSDYATSFATVPLDDLLAAME